MSLRSSLLLASLLLASLLPAGCSAVTPPPDTARLPPDAFGINADGDIGAMNQAQWAFASPARTRNDPADAARAVAAVDYLAGALSSSPRWDFMSPLTKQEMLWARAEVRQAVGIAPAAPSQEVVNRLLYAGNALAASNPAAAETALQPPVFTWPPQQTLAVLSAMPFLREANIATQHAATQAQRNDRGSDFSR
jgi:hypothetical protein